MSQNGDVEHTLPKKHLGENNLLEDLEQEGTQPLDGRHAAPIESHDGKPFFTSQGVNPASISCEKHVQPLLHLSMERYRASGRCFPLVASVLCLLVFVVVVPLLLRDPWNVRYYSFQTPESHADREGAWVVTKEGGFDMVAAARLWGRAVGCAAFRKKHQDTIRKFATGKPYQFPKNPSLQDPASPKCSKMKLKHVTIYAAPGKVAWLRPGKLEGSYYCPRCGLTCELTWSKAMGVSADAHLSVWQSEPHWERKTGGSYREPIRAHMLVESWGFNKEERDHKKFELGISFAPESDVQLTYWDVGNSLWAGRQRNISSFKRQDVPLFRAGSNCKSEFRNHLVDAVFERVPHHSFGACQNNVNGTGKEAEFYPDCNHGYMDRQESTACTMSHYKFHLAIENSKVRSYITEKMFFSLTAGTVPVYVGAPDVTNFMPPDSFIDGQLYSPDELSELILTVHKDPVKYMNYFGWKMCGVLGNLEHTIALGYDSLPCRLCEKVSAMGGRMYGSSVTS